MNALDRLLLAYATIPVVVTHGCLGHSQLATHIKIAKLVNLNRPDLFCSASSLINVNPKMDTILCPVKALTDGTHEFTFFGSESTDFWTDCESVQ